MIGLILAAGRGSRLGNYTDDSPKSLLPLNDDEKTLLDFNIEILKSISVDKIIIVTGYKSKQIEQVAARQVDIHVETVYNPFWNHCNVLGSMYMALDHIKDDFLFLHADTLMEQAAWEKLCSSQEGDMILPYEEKKCGEEEMKVIIENDKIIKISKLFDPNLAAGEFTGIALFKKVTVDYFKATAARLFKTGDLNQYMEAVIQESIDEKAHDIRALDISEYDFVEVDFEEDYLRAKDVFGS